MFLRKRLTFGWCQMIDGSQLTRCCRITVVWVDPATITLLRRWSCCSSDMTSVADQRCKRVVADTVIVSQEMPCSATPYTSLINFRPQSNSDWLRGGVKSLIYYALVITDFHQFKNISFSRFVLSGRLGWRHGLIWPLIGWPYLQVLIHISMCMRCGSLVVKSMTISLFILWRRHPIYILRLYTVTGVRHHG